MNVNISPDELRNLIPLDREGDRLFSYIRFLQAHGRRPDDRAMLINDVLHRIKTSDELLDPLRVITSDKHWAKMYIASEIGQSYCVPTLAIVESPDGLSSLVIPEDSCIKPTHLSGHMSFFRAGTPPPDKSKMASWFQRNHYLWEREINYRHLKPRIIVEPLLFEIGSVIDYKIFCVQGKAKVVYIEVESADGRRSNYYDTSWDFIDVEYKNMPQAGMSIPAPDNLDEMLEIASRLSRHFSFVRIDLYSDGRKLFAGEITHCDGAAVEPLRSLDEEKLLSDLLFS